jgi:hypothetical protein
MRNLLFLAALIFPALLFFAAKDHPVHAGEAREQRITIPYSTTFSDPDDFNTLRLDVTPEAFIIQDLANSRLIVFDRKAGIVTGKHDIPSPILSFCL